MVICKSPEELEKMHRAGLIVWGALEKMRDLGALRYMLPGMAAELDEIDRTFGGDPWPYVIEPNRPTLEALVRYMAEQSLIKAPIPVDELFVPIYGQ